jgi:hypothetical protein
MATAKQLAAQRRQTLKELATELRRRDAAKLSELRAAIAAKRAAKRDGMRAVTQQCRAGRDRVREQAAQLRDRVKREIAELVQTQRSQCSASREMTREQSRAALAAAVKALLEERGFQAEMRRAEGRARKATRVDAARARIERKRESDEEVERNLEPELVPVWKRVKRTIKEGPRRSRTEAFLEWAAENAPTVWRIQNEEHERDVERLVAEERDLAREMKRARRYRDPAPHLAADEVPF